MVFRQDRIRTRITVIVIVSLFVWTIFVGNKGSVRDNLKIGIKSRVFKDNRIGSVKNTIQSRDPMPYDQIALHDVIMTVRTTTKNTETRMKALFESWLPSALKRSDFIYIFSDGDDPKISNKVPNGHFVNTNCGMEHTRKDLCCKMSKELTFFTGIDKKWYCLFDDDIYLNVDNLLTLLRGYDYNGLWYIGKNDQEKKPHSIPKQRYRNVTFWFHNRGSGICLSRGLFQKMKPIIRDDGLAKLAPSIGLLDDLVLGFIINHMLGVDLTYIDLFHSQWERMSNIKDLEKQITLGYKETSNNFLNVEGFSKEDDPYRFRSLHCKLHPEEKMCFKLRNFNNGASSFTFSIMHLAIFISYLIFK